MHPIIGITAGEILNKLYPHSPPAQGQSHTYVDAIVRARGAPFILPLTKDRSVLRNLYEQCAGIMLAGGNDLDPKLYGEEPAKHTVDQDPPRDAQELQLLEWALEDDKPVLAICRGMQLINVSQGGNLYQHIPDDLPEAEVHNIAPEKQKESRIVHSLHIDPESELSKTLGTDTLGTNAYHHQAIKEIGKDLVATAWTADGVIEALEMPKYTFVVAVQSHPESLEESIEPLWRKVFESFVEASREFKKQQPESELC